MLTTDLLKRLQRLPYTGRVELKQDEITIESVWAKEIATVFVKERFSLATSYREFDRLRPSNQEELFNLLVEYSRTPVEQREMMLSDDEMAILKGLKGYNWISRNENNSLVISIDKPSKHYPEGRWFTPSTAYIHFFNHLFNFIQWEDEEPYSISELLGEEIR